MLWEIQGSWRDYKHQSCKKIDVCLCVWGMSLLETEGSLPVYGAKSASCRLWLRLSSTVVFILTSRRKTGKKFVLAFVSDSINFTKACLWKYFVFLSLIMIMFTYVSYWGGFLTHSFGQFGRISLMNNSSLSPWVDAHRRVFFFFFEMLIKFVLRINRIGCESHLATGELFISLNWNRNVWIIQLCYNIQLCKQAAAQLWSLGLQKHSIFFSVYFKAV